MVGFTDQAKHQYDLSALFTINSVSGATSRTYDITGFQPGVKLPAVTFLKAPGFMDGHAAYSDPLLEQHFIVQVANTVMTSKHWKEILDANTKKIEDPDNLKAGQSLNIP